MGSGKGWRRFPPRGFPPECLGGGSFRCPSRRGARRGAAMAQNLKDLAGRLPAGPRGVGTALKLLLGAGALAYGVRESVFIGEFPPPPAPRFLRRPR